MGAPGTPKAATTAAKVEKVVPPTPPNPIWDRRDQRSYKRTGFLGEGGFARVWEVQDENGRRRAVKVVHKANIKSRKNKTKLWAEIKLHQMMQHPNIVRFDDCFEDEENVYMLLELCEHGSLMDLLKRRKRYTEPEARVLLVQIIAACQYMHGSNVIHRDLKLGNIFFDKDMNVKVGDFGLAALIENPGDRKKTICGTPNYIAPEVLFDQVNGHSFEVDVWSVGVILYTLLIGRPPFQTKDVKAIYKRIRENRYEFPHEVEISSSARHLIMKILNPNPDQRPTLEHIMKDRWFFDGPFPPYVPVTAHDSIPSFEHLTTTQWRRNFEAVCHRSKLGQVASNGNVGGDAGARIRADLGPSIVQQDKDFRYAVQPDSPVGALIQSARQPLIQAPAQIKEPALLRKLSAVGAQATLSPVRRGAASSSRPSLGAPSARRSSTMAPVGEEDEEDGVEDEAPAAATEPRYERGVREREIATQKARLVSQMAAQREREYESASSQDREVRGGGRDVQYQQPQAAPQRQQQQQRRGVETRAAAAAAAAATVATRQPLGPTRVVPAVSANGYGARGGAGEVYEPVKPKPARVEYDRTGGARRAVKRENDDERLFETVGRTLVAALAASQTAVGYLAREEIVDARAPSVFVVSWLDYCQKYGMGLAMCDGSISVHFNDSSSLAWSPNKLYLDYIQPSGRGAYSRANYAYAAVPTELGNKTYLLKHFDKYIHERLYGGQPYLRDDASMSTGMVIVTRYLRMKHVIVFRLSNSVVQFNFFDHTKLILSRDGEVVSFIDKYYELHTWSTEQLLRAHKGEIADRTERKRVDGVVYKLQYSADVLVKIQSHGAEDVKSERESASEAERYADADADAGADGHMPEPEPEPRHVGLAGRERERRPRAIR